MSLQIEAWIYFHSKTEIFGGAVFCVSAYWLWCLWLETLGHSPGPRLLMARAPPPHPAPHACSPTRAHVVADPGLAVLVRVAGCPQQQPSGTFEKTSFASHRSWRVYGRSNGHTGKSQRERERDHGVLSSWGLRTRSLSISWSVGFKGQEGRSRVTQVVSYLDHPGLSKRGIPWLGQPSPLARAAAGHLFIRDGSLKWSPSPSKS